MEREITQEVLKLKVKVLNDLDGTADFYKTYRHVSGDFSISEHLLNQCMQAAYYAGVAAGRNDAVESYADEGYDDDYS